MAPRVDRQELLAVRDLSATYRGRGPRRRPNRAVDGVSFSLERGEAVGLIGESGCGKSTLARTIVRLQEPDSGSLVFDGVDISHEPTRRLKRHRRGLALVFQDPSTSFNPRRTIRRSLAEAVEATRGRGSASHEHLVGRLARVGLGEEVIDRYPHQLSGGQLQRASIARAPACDPRLIVLDEPVSAFDILVQAQVLEVLRRVRSETDAALLLIAHDLARLAELLVRHGGETYERHLDAILASPGTMIGSSPTELVEREERERANGSMHMDDYAALGEDVTEADLVELFSDRFYFGCEADDPTVRWCFDEAAGLDLEPIFSSDISHWDVTHMNETVQEAYELVERGLITEGQFRRFVFDYPVEMRVSMAPDFFAGTRIADPVPHAAAPAP